MFLLYLVSYSKITNEVLKVHIIGKIDKKIYECILKDIITDTVIITDNQIQHIKERHPNDYERFSSYFREIIEKPDFIIEANKPNTALILKEIQQAEEQFKTVLRLVTSTDNPTFELPQPTLRRMGIPTGLRPIPTRSAHGCSNREQTLF